MNSIKTIVSNVLKNFISNDISLDEVTLLKELKLSDLSIVEFTIFTERVFIKNNIPLELDDNYIEDLFKSDTATIDDLIKHITTLVE